MTTRMVVKERPARRFQRLQKQSSKDNPNFKIPWGQVTWPRGGGGVNPPPVEGHLGYYVYTTAPTADGEADHQGTLEQVRAADTDGVGVDLLAALATVGFNDVVSIRSSAARYAITVNVAGYSDPIFTFDGVDPPLQEIGTFADDDIISLGVLNLPPVPPPGTQLGEWIYDAATPDADGEIDHQGTAEQVVIAATNGDAVDQSALLDTVEVGDEVWLTGPNGTYGITVIAVDLTTGIYTFDGDLTVLEERGSLIATDPIQVGIVIV